MNALTNALSCHCHFLRFVNILTKYHSVHSYERLNSYDVKVMLYCTLELIMTMMCLV